MTLSVVVYWTGLVLCVLIQNYNIFGIFNLRIVSDLKRKNMPTSEIRPTCGHAVNGGGRTIDRVS
jgi:hypothetical protein